MSTPMMALFSATLAMKAWTRPGKSAATSAATAATKISMRVR